MGEIIPWLLVGTGLCLLAGWLVLRRRTDAPRIDEPAERDAAERAERERTAALEAELEAQRQTEHRAEEERRAAERAAHERSAAARRREAAERTERERIAALEAELEAQRQAEQHAEALRLAAERASVERIAAERRHEAAERAEQERLAALEAQREAQRRAAEQAARELQAQAETRRQAELRADQERAAAARAESERAEAERTGAERAAAVPRRASKTAAQTLVLVADDSKVVRIKTGRLLAQHQYQVAYASDGLDAVQQMRAQRPDVLITDVEMPGMDGFELTRHIRADPQTAQLPVVMITAADDRHRQQADAAGVSVLLGKPYPEDALIAHIRLAMGHDEAAPRVAAASAHGALDTVA